MSPTYSAITAFYGVKVFSNQEEYSDFLGLPSVDLEKLGDAELEVRWHRVRQAIMKYDFCEFLYADVDELCFVAYDDYEDITLVFGIPIDVDDGSIDHEYLSHVIDDMKERKGRIVNPVLRKIFEQKPAIHLIVTSDVLRAWVKCPDLPIIKLSY